MSKIKSLIIDLKFILLGAAGVLVLNSCKSYLEKFDSLQEGIDKDQVLSEVGSPNSSMRRAGKDRWIYRIYDQKLLVQREAHFSEGVLVYRGQPVPPKISAAEQDTLNQVANAQAEIESQKNRQSAKQSLQSYEVEVKGSDEVRFVPTFTPIN